MECLMRTYSIKQNYSPRHWPVLLMTGHVILSKLLHFLVLLRIKLAKVLVQCTAGDGCSMKFAIAFKKHKQLWVVDLHKVHGGWYTHCFLLPYPLYEKTLFLLLSQPFPSFFSNLFDIYMYKCLQLKKEGSWGRQELCRTKQADPQGLLS